MLIIRGVNVFPTQVEDVLGRVPELSPHYQLVVSRDGDDGRARGAHRGDRATSSAPSGAELLADDAIEADHALRELRGRVSGLIKDTIGCSMKVTIVAPGTVPRSEGGKLSRVLDTGHGAEA